MLRQTPAGFGRAIVVPFLLLSLAAGCEDQNQSMQWGNMGNWNLFGAGTHTHSYNLQYPLAQPQVVHPGASVNESSGGGIANLFTPKTHTKTYNLQYPIGNPQPVKASAAPVAYAPSQAPINENSGGISNNFSSNSYTRSYKLQYPIGSPQGVNGHASTGAGPTNSFNKHYKLQYPVGQPQVVRRGGSAPRYASNNHGGNRPSMSSSRTVSTAPVRSQAMARAASPGSYVVRPGDTLMSIARSHYGPRGAGRYQDILNANRNLIDRPDQIVPGMTLRIP